MIASTASQTPPSSTNSSDGNNDNKDQQPQIQHITAKKDCHGI